MTRTRRAASSAPARPLEGIAGLRADYADFPLRKPDPNVHRELERGWILPYLLRIDELTWKRWDYWYALASQPAGEHALPREPIPQIDFLGEGGSELVSWSRLAPLAVDADRQALDVVRQVDDDLPEIADAYAANEPTRGGMLAKRARILSPNTAAGWARTRKLWEHVFSQVADAWQGWGSSTYIDYVFDWLLFGFGYNAEAPKEPYGCEGASDRLYQTFDLGPMVLWPYDYLGDLFAEMSIGRHAGFYPTPHNVVQPMVDMTMGDATADGKDLRLATTCDPCMGTGRMLLLASNRTLCLAGQDINPLVCKATLINGFLYAPWLVRPIEWVWQLAGAADLDTPLVVSQDEAEPTLMLPGVKLSRRARRQVSAGQLQM